MAKWLRGAMRGPSGKDSPLVKDVAKKAKVSRTTLWRMMNSETDADEDTLLRIAAALKVPPPRVQMVLRLEDPRSPFRMPPLAKLREAEALIREAVAELDATPASKRDAAAEILAEDAVLDRLPPGRPAHRSRKRRHSGPA